jgi:lipopolysaccharide biosynthesis glycosyltransferase
MANFVSAGTSPCSDDQRRVRYSQRVSRAAYVFALVCFFFAGYTVISTDAPTSTQPTAPNTTQLGPWNFETPRNLPCSRMTCGHMTLRPWEHPSYTQPATGLSQCGQLQAQSRAHAKRPKAVVTFLSSPNYLPMVFTLLQSLSASGYRGERVVATLAPASEDERHEKAEMLRRLLQKFPGVQTTTWRMMLPRTKTAELPRWTKNYAKLNLFQMTAYSTILYIDADILVLQHPRVIFKHAVELDVETTESMRWFWSAPDWGTWVRPPSASMNGGVLLLRPSMELFKCMTRVLHSVNSAEYSHQSAEQGFLRYFFGDEATTLSALFNMQKSNLGFLRASFLGDEATTPTTELSYRNELYQTASWNRIVLLHDTGSKPFRTWSSPLYLKEYRDASTRISLMKEDLIDDEEEVHVPALNVWRQYYFTVAGFSSQLNLFVAYHDQASHARIRALRRAHPPGVSLVSHSRWFPQRTAWAISVLSLSSLSSATRSFSCS